MSEQENNFRITRLEQEVDFFRKTTEQSLVDNGKKIDRILNVLQSDEALATEGLVEKVNKLETKFYSLRNFIRAYKLAIAMLASFFTGLGALISWYFNIGK